VLNLFRAIFAPPRDLILLFAAGWLGLMLAGRQARRMGGDEKALDALSSVMILAFIIGGRLLFAASHLPAFIQSPVSLISLNTSLFDGWGALACAAVVGAVVIQRKHMQGWHAMDLLTPFFAALAVGLSLSHLASGAAFGSETTLPWAVDLWGASRHPTQIYEFLTATAALAIILSWQLKGPAGMTFLVWIALAAASRLLVGAYRGDSTLVFGGLRLAQILAWLTLAAALGCMELLQRTAKRDSTPNRSKQMGTVPDENRAQ
jgi:phosphatidylglycerol---prolipoprotein diacylglyceryl transferase